MSAGSNVSPLVSPSGTVAQPRVEWQGRLSPWVVGVSLLAIGVGLASAWGLAEFRLVAESRVLAVTIFMTTLGLAGTALMSNGRPLRLSLASLQLGSWTGVGFTLGYGVATLVWWSRDLNYRGFATAETLHLGALVAGFGFASFVGGYLVAPRLLRAGASTVLTRLRGRTATPGYEAVWLLFAVFLVSQGLMYRSGNFGYLSDPAAALSSSSSAAALVNALSQTGPLATLTAAWLHAGRRSMGSTLLLGLVILTQMGLGLFAGVKEIAIVQLVAVVIGLSSRARLRIGPMVAAGVVTFFVISPFVSAYRDVVLHGSARLSPAEALREVDFGPLLRDAVTGQNTPATSAAGQFDRWSRIGDVTIIATQTPSPIPYQSPAELAAGPFLGVIPRSIWHGKPVLDAGYQVNQRYYHAPPAVYSSAAVTPYGDLYRHGGYVVVIIGMLIIGGMVRLVDSDDRRSIDRDPRVLFLPMLLFPSLVKQEMDFIAFSASLPGVLLAATLAARLAAVSCGRERRR